MPAVEQTFETPEPGALHVAVRDGRVRITVTEAATTRVRVTGALAEQVDITCDRGALRVTGPRGRDTDPHADHRLDVEVEGPVGRQVDVETTGADVEVRGEVEVEQVQAQSGTGDLRVERAVEVRLKSGAGDVTLGHLLGRTRISTSAGDVLVGVPDGLAVWTEISSVSGDITSSVRGRGAPGRKERHVELRVTTGSGDVALVRAEDQPFIATPSRQ